MVSEPPPPIPNATGSIWRLVIDDMEAREAFGIQEYGTPLQIDNGRPGLDDTYLELLDACVYLRKEIEERADIYRKARAEAARAVLRLGEDTPGADLLMFELAAAAAKGSPELE